jgi:hypothetical protein
MSEAPAGATEIDQPGPRRVRVERLDDLEAGVRAALRDES